MSALFNISARVICARINVYYQMEKFAFFAFSKRSSLTKIGILSFFRAHWLDCAVLHRHEKEACSRFSRLVSRNCANFWLSGQETSSAIIIQSNIRNSATAIWPLKWRRPIRNTYIFNVNIQLLKMNSTKFNGNAHWNAFGWKEMHGQM